MHETSNRAAAPARPLHPLAREATRLLEVADGELILSRASSAVLRAALVAMFDSADLEWAVRSLVITASRLDARGATVAADALVSVASCAAPELWKNVASRSNERRRNSTAKIERLLGKKREPTPRFCAPHKDSVRVSNLFSSPRRA